MNLNDYEIKHNQFLRENGAECTVLLQKDGHFPLSAPCSIALYGNGARKTIKGGTGSGEVNSRFFVTVEDGLKAAGFEITSNSWLNSYDRIYDAAMKQFIRSVKAEAKAKHKQAILLGMGRTMLEPEYDLKVDALGDTAIYVLARTSGEGSDRKPVAGDILLTETEIRDILACNAKYENFMLVINAGGVVDLSPVKAVKNLLILSQLGVETGDILADILLGKSNPSGKLATTWTKWEEYSTIGEFGDDDETRYKEGIYVGYRYFDSIGKKALYPFGYGLSYSEFGFQETDFIADKETVRVTTKVINMGQFEGKEAVQVYVSMPEGKLNQPYQVLAGFCKTKMLAPGESEKIAVSFSMKDLASYDEENAAYILEKGDYILRIGNSSAETIICGVITLQETITVLQAKNVLGKPDFKDVVFQKGGRESCDDVKHIVMDSKIFERVNLAYNPRYDVDDAVKKMTEDQLIKMNIGAYEPGGVIASMIGNSGFTVAGAAGQSFMGVYDLGIPSMIMADGPAGVRISKEYAMSPDGIAHTLGPSLPESMLMFMPKIVKLFMRFNGYKVKKDDVIREQYTTAIPIGTAIAQSFNIEFAEKCGDIVGFEMEKFGVNLWLAPALNIHRSIQCGRNFEYYSEDPLLSGEFTAAITKGVQSHAGCGVTIKHYAANNQETNRTQSNSRVSERAMREIYLKGFGIAVRKSQPKAVMTSYNLVNGVHTGEHRGLIEDILRVEYGFEGIVMTDWNVGNFTAEREYTHPLSIAPKTVMAGNDIFMPGGHGDYSKVKKALENGEVTREQLQINASRVARMARNLVKRDSEVKG